MEKVHLRNAKKIKDMIDKMGFPVLSNAGETGVRLSWSIIHHAISSPDFMKESLLQMKLAAAQNDYLLELIAHTDDRIAYFQGRPQLYGTSMDWINGELCRTPVEDIDRMDLRRKSFGLPPISKVPNIPSMERPPKDALKKENEFKLWLVKVGRRI